MSNPHKLSKLFFVIILLFIFGVVVFKYKNTSELPLVAIANYGPHSSLEASIAGIKAELARLGFIENKTITYEVADVGFDLSLIPQMITSLKSKKPQLMIVISTPIAQFAKHAVLDVPLVFAAITEPVEAGLLPGVHKADVNMTGASDRQNLTVLLQFAEKLIPNANRIGVLYATGEANDMALVKMLKQAACKTNMQVVAIPIDEPRDVPLRMQLFNNQVDLIYVETSGTIQPTLPAIVAAANKMRIPVFNVDSAAVQQHQVLASFGVDYYKVGVNAGKIAAQVLNGAAIQSIPPQYPTLEDHNGFISKQQLETLGLKLPNNLTNVTVVE